MPFIKLGRYNFKRPRPLNCWCVPGACTEFCPVHVDGDHPEYAPHLKHALLDLLPDGAPMILIFDRVTGNLATSNIGPTDV